MIYLLGFLTAQKPQCDIIGYIKCQMNITGM